VLRGKLRRIVPRDNDAINESWISDRDRFSCFGLYSEDRLEHPMIKRDQQWVEVSWPEAIEHTVKALRAAVGEEADALGVLASPSSTVEELWLLKKLARHMRSRSIDYRLRRRDFRDEANDPVWPWLGTRIAEIPQRDGILVVGSNLRMEAPIIAHHVRKAALAGAEVGFVNPARYPVRFSSKAQVETTAEDMVGALAGVLAAVLQVTAVRPDPMLGALLGAHPPSPEQRAAASVLLGKQRGWLLLGQLAERHPKFTEIRYLAAHIATATGASLGYLPEGANAAGAAMLGFASHRVDTRTRPANPGLNVGSMLSAPRHAYILHGIEPGHDIANGERAEAALKSADVVVALTAFADDALLDCCTIVLPIASFAETDGTYVNAEGLWQSFAAAADCPGDSRPAWRVLRVLASTLGAEGCDYQEIDQIRAEVRAAVGEPAGGGYTGSPELDLEAVAVDLDEIDVPIYAVDPLCRRSLPLQQTAIAIGREEGEPSARRTA
jgi:NADH-quinone oxidoreductase subunit G